MTESWPEQRARLELIVQAANPFHEILVEDRTAIRAALARIDYLEQFEPVRDILNPKRQPSGKICCHGTDIEERCEQCIADTSHPVLPEHL